MKKVLFALTPAQQLANGSSLYTEFVFRKALETGKPFDAYYNPVVEENKSIVENIPKHITLHQCTNTAELEQLIAAQNYDTVFFGNETDTGVRLPESVTPVVVIHDLRFIEVPNDKTRPLYRKSAFERFKQRAISRLSPDYDALRQKKRILNFIDRPKLRIVTVSNHTKYSVLLNFPQVKDEQIRVLASPYPEIGVGDDISDNGELLNKLNLEPKGYFLLISAGRWFKNAYRAIRALDDLAGKKLLKDKKVLVIGTREGLKITHVKNSEHFVFLNYVENDTLQCAFRNAFCFVYPSLQEGFGIPPLEAMQYGTPVLAAATTAIHEVCESGAGYFNPYSVMEIENRMLRLLNDTAYYEQLCLEGRQRSREIAIKQKQDLETLLKLIFE